MPSMHPVEHPDAHGDGTGLREILRAAQHDHPIRPRPKRALPAKT